VFKQMDAARDDGMSLLPDHLHNSGAAGLGPAYTKLNDFSQENCRNFRCGQGPVILLLQLTHLFRRNWSSDMQYLSYAAIARSSLLDPFQYVIVPNCIERDALSRINSDFPTVPGPGSHPPSELEVRGHFAGLLKELEGPMFRDAVEKKFGIDLEQRPTMCTVRGYLQKRRRDPH
jgi:hypothetical protein